MGNFELIDVYHSDKWNKYLGKLLKEQKDIYYTPEYYSLYENNNDGKAFCFVYTDGDNIALYPYLRNSISDLGYDLNKEYYDIQGAYGYNGVISNNYTFEFRAAFYSTFNKYCKETNIIAEFTRFHPILKNHIFSNGFITTVKDRNTVILHLEKAYNEIWMNEYSSKNRNMIRKAHNMKYQVKIWERPSSKNISNFIELYHNTMRRINAEKYYYFNKKYFTDILNNFNSNSILFEVVNYKNEIECAIILLEFGVYTQYHLSCRKADSDNSVNNFILDEAIKYSMSRGMKYFHLGGGTTSNQDDPLYKFKSNFSKTYGEFFIGKKIHNPQIYNSILQQWLLKNLEDNERLLRYRKLYNE